jgi:hypothetical protein
MRQVNLRIAVAAALCLGTVPALAAGDEWQVDARACADMAGAPGDAYRAACQQQDQYDSILACQTAAGDENAVSRIKMAGRDDVNTYMEGFGPIAGCK